MISGKKINIMLKIDFNALRVEIRSDSNKKKVSL